MYCMQVIYFTYIMCMILYDMIYMIYIYICYLIYIDILYIYYTDILFIYICTYIYICMYVIYIYMWYIERESERERKRERKVDDEENSVFLYLSTISFWCLFKCSSMSFQILKRHQKLVLFKRRVPFIIYISHSFLHVKFRLYVCECIF